MTVTGCKLSPNVHCAFSATSASFAPAAAIPSLAMLPLRDSLAPFSSQQFSFELRFQKEMALVLRYPRARRLEDGAEVDETKIAHPLVELCLTSGKGLGLFARSNIKAGTCILSGKPLIVLPSKDFGIYHDLQQQLAKLSPHEQNVFHSLSSSRESVRKRTKLDIEFEAAVKRTMMKGEKQLVMEARKVSTFRTNAKPLSPSLGYGIFPLSSRINHDCTPNAYACYNPTLGVYTVFATRDISAQEEITVAYVNPAQDREDREEELGKPDINIYCRCTTCRIALGRQTSDRKRYSIDQATRGLAVYDGTAPTKGTKEYAEWRRPDIVPQDPNMALIMAESGISLMREEGLVNMNLAKLQRQASKISLQLGKVDKAKLHATKEAEVERLCLGASTDYLNHKSVDEGGGNAVAWMREIQRLMEKDGVRIRMNEKRVAKEEKKAEKKAAKKKERK